MGTGDVSFQDMFHRITTGSHGIYAEELDETMKEVPVFIYPDGILTLTPSGLTAANELLGLYLDTFEKKETSPFGLKGNYQSRAQQTLDHLIQLPKKPTETCILYKNKWNMANVLDVHEDYVDQLRLTGNNLQCVAKYLTEL